MVTDHEPGLSSKYGNVPLILQVFSQSCEKFTDAIKHSELPIIHFKWYGIITQLCSIVHMHSCTLYTPAVAEPEPLIWAVFCRRKKVLCLFEAWGCWGRRRVSQGWQKHFSFGQANIGQELYYAEAVKQQIICTE